jgi:hypothetical protein
MTVFSSFAQVLEPVAKDEDEQQKSCFGRRLVDNLGVGVNIGTTGIGIDVSTKLADFASVRMGVDYTPGFTVPMTFDVNCYTEGTLLPTKFGKLQELMQEFTGFYVDDKVKMECQAKMVNFKLLVDFFPLRNKHWYVTAGFYWGSSYVAKSINARGEMSSLLAIAMYNKMYDYFMTTDFMEEPIYNDYYLDPDVADAVRERFERYGRVGVHMGDYKDGSLYMMEPGEDGMVKAKAYVNSFKPYLGLGYKTSLGEHVDLGVDFGAMMWGGAPKIVTHEGVDLVRDIENIPGKVGDYVKIAKNLKVYPVLSATFTYRFKSTSKR